ncbi:hypothetical protein TGAM01_v208859 [Trichoderma gamsii]|uniref:Uncharacterized protein n=1 Tax=Trichoderma gamsii TaxID=398673 RepID=A0A2P4ZD09_9HYPO|nr:hypothetical protein TGAM01_v208859 [Trichoderma gamsii]PON22178.1 hypothetical protein TGAM01_v208859 [Trichoderma gamsii]
MLSVTAACGNVCAAKSLVGKDKSLLDERVSAATPLVVAYSNVNHGMVEFLLELGADPISGAEPTTRGLWAPLAIAATFKHRKAMEILLEHKASVDSQGLKAGTTPLLYAVEEMSLSHTFTS